ncbi:aldehyde ferredoxin oxidoreductase family protein [Sinanaerobacter chloroacetimidivorans]|uniref:Aldehyde ferredoxin oxidoreductase family protein n=1 Tax=Sinanaerobacter chloroacetimidivorans TaxID=2818044 RepID=A0A8J7W072_9FIRM|nr:aldehyde ferredoxin oxidoreductase family protein [Sinanaerobacter chloroacetimidivorans]MBR0598392.1 aldehyde ferredoxin oxidoreductase family protein [Sinanaerobacter chloroacetimidivorans]
MQGYQNKILRVDLNNKEIITEPLNTRWAEKYIGGKGLAIKYLYEELKAGIDPLSAENKMILMTGPFTGTPVPCSGKLSIASKSPATGTILDCSIGGHAANRIKYAGYDAIVLEGKLDQPGYLLIQNHKVEFKNAIELWGKGSHETESILINKYGKQASILSIGPAGENLLGTACINSDYYRQAGRGGIGAVMGSKNLKAIVIIGTGSVKVHDIVNTTKRIHEILREDTLTDSNLWTFSDGTACFVEACNDGGILPVKNFSDATLENWSLYSSENMKANRSGKKGCGSCGLGCGNFTKINGTACEGPEYETIAVAGPNCGITDIHTILKFNQICDDLGIDTISTGDTIAYAMEMTEKGLHDFGIRFGEGDKLIEYLEMIATKRDVGAELCLGVKKLAEKYGGKDFAMHVKGLEYPQYEPRGSWATALAYAVSDRGACHMRAYPPAEEVYSASVPPYTSEGKGQLVYELAKYSAVKFSLILCDFWALSMDRMAELLTIVTGKQFSEEDMDDVAERVLHIARAFNQREGFDRKDDTVPKRIINEALKSGAAAGQRIPEADFTKMLDEYYEALGWNMDGTVPICLLAEL